VRVIPFIPAAASGMIGWAQAAILGVVEGLTEYLPVSSTAHIDLAGRWLGVADVPGFASFDIVIQLGAILAVLVHYRALIAERLHGLVRRDPVAIRLWLAIAAGFIPTAIIGLLLHRLILQYLFGLVTIAAAFVVGGVVMIAVEAWRKRSGRTWRDGLEQVTPLDGLVIGLGQCVAMIPGTSRSMATIVTGQLRGLSTATAAEFSFLLGLPTLGAATIYEGYKARQELVAHAGSGSVLIGLVVSLVVALVVIAGFLQYLKRRGLEPFGYYRMALGAILFWLVLH
jgi:undecaprenyl-diphosphatase